MTSRDREDLHQCNRTDEIWRSLCERKINSEPDRPALKWSGGIIAVECSTMFLRTAAVRRQSRSFRFAAGTSRRIWGRELYIYTYARRLVET